MKVKLLRAWRWKKVGTVFETSDGVANVLIRRNVAVEDKPPATKPFKQRSIKEEPREPLP